MSAKLNIENYLRIRKKDKLFTKVHKIFIIGNFIAIHINNAVAVRWIMRLFEDMTLEVAYKGVTVFKSIEE